MVHATNAPADAADAPPPDRVAGGMRRDEPQRADDPRHADDPSRAHLEHAACLARELYGIAATPAPLPGERDRNVLLRAGAGAAFVLKLSAPGEARGVLECQAEVLERLAAGAQPFRFPRVVPSLAGNGIETVRLEDGAERFVRLLEYIPGTPLARVRPHGHALLEGVGRLLGTVDRALAGYAHPAAERVLPWDLSRGREVVERHLAEVGDAARRARVERFVARFEADGAPRIPALRTGIIHGDGNDWNVLVAEGDDSSTPRKVVGLIDFGDLVHSWLAAEPAIAAAYAMMDHDDPLAAAAQVVRGYHATFPLTEPETEALFPLICLRLCVSVVLAAHQRRREPDNAYLSVSEAPAWALLERLETVDPRRVTDALREACGAVPAGAGRVEVQRATGRSTAPQPDIVAAEPGVRTASAAAASGRAATTAATPMRRDEILAARRARIGHSLRLSYREPLHIVRGWMQYLYDDAGRAYLDCVNNVAHVGHGHPRVVDALARQARVLNTNTRYLHEHLVRYAERLTATLPEPLRVCFFTCSGSEANELALRLARTHTGRRDVVVLEAAYHGNTNALIDLSPYKFHGPGGRGAPPTTHVVPLPDPYRGRYRGTGADIGRRYAAHVRDAVERLAHDGRGVAAFFSESLPGCGGQIVLPDGFLAEAYRHVREAGGICVADEVQVGFGRVGTHFWGFETQGVVPDIVTMGKPIGNGHPLGAVVTTPEIAASFDNGMEYFNTFGGNPVSCAVGLAVLDVIEAERLQERAHRVGARLLEGLRRLAERHPLIGDVRGMGLFLGIELVLDRETLEPAPDHAARVVERMRENGILLSTDGPLHNVIKIKPPLQFAEEDADRVVEVLGAVLAEAALRLE
ncbi:MAG TPA: aminotransferase class III-fold pyridoxal phosphate-dependent enzyme [Longimicrobiales bacterium]